MAGERMRGLILEERILLNLHVELAHTPKDRFQTFFQSDFELLEEMGKQVPEKDKAKIKSYKKDQEGSPRKRTSTSMGRSCILGRTRFWRAQ